MAPGRLVLRYTDRPPKRRWASPSLINVIPDEQIDPDEIPAAETVILESPQVPAIGDISFTSIGRYRLLQKIGEGGMGEVWLARQDEPVRRQVAIKLIKAGMNTREVVARFESERQALASMDHPSIAKVFDAGTTPVGAPYFVMEYVPGVPITAYCDEHRLNTRERLQLFLRVCESVQHAHQKAIIHRDLKPSNILVTEIDGRPAPKIIDFGVAKALGQKLVDDSSFTRIGAIIGTPEYMSPEQALSSGAGVDTRTDVYSLGIVLYELLAGVAPLTLQTITFDEFLYRLRHEDPRKPSTAISTQDPATSADIAQKRRSVPRALVKEVRGDLDTIVLKAVNRDVARRYRSVEQLADDILRHLENRPVMARPDTLLYRLSRFTVRNRWAIAAGLALVLSLAAGAGISLYQARVARQRFDQVRKLAARFIEMNDDVGRLPGSTAVREKLVATALDYLSSLARSAGNDPQLLDEVGEAYGKVAEAQGAPGQPNLGKTEEALRSFRKGIEYERRAAAKDPAYLHQLASLQSKLGYTTMLAGHPQEAQQNLDEAAALLATLRAAKPDDAELLRISSNVAMYQGDLMDYKGNTPQGLTFYQRARDLAAAYARAQPDDRARSRLYLVSTVLATSLAENGRYEEALAMLRQSEPIAQALLAADPDNPAYIRQSMSAANLESSIYDGPEGQCLGKPVEAVAAARRYLAMAQRLVAQDPHNASARLSLAVANFQISYPLGKIDRVESLRTAQQGVRILEEDLARSPNDYLLRSRHARALRYLSYALARNSRPDEAARMLQQAIQIHRQLLAESPSDAHEREQLATAQKALSDLQRR